MSTLVVPNTKNIYRRKSLGEYCNTNSHLLRPRSCSANDSLISSSGYCFVRKSLDSPVSVLTGKSGSILCHHVIRGHRSTSRFFLFLIYGLLFAFCCALLFALYQLVSIKTEEGQCAGKACPDFSSSEVSSISITASHSAPASNAKNEQNSDIHIRTLETLVKHEYDKRDEGAAAAAAAAAASATNRVSTPEVRSSKSTESTVKCNQFHGSADVATGLQCDAESKFLASSLPTAGKTNRPSRGDEYHKERKPQVHRVPQSPPDSLGRRAHEAPSPKEIFNRYQSHAGNPRSEYSDSTFSHMDNYGHHRQPEWNPPEPKWTGPEPQWNSRQPQWNLPENQWMSYEAQGYRTFPPGVNPAVYREYL